MNPARERPRVGHEVEIEAGRGLDIAAHGNEIEPSTSVVRSEQLAQVQETIRQTGNDRLMVGFNRRFATVLNGMRAGWGVTGGPQVVHYTVNAGPLEAKSWYGQTALQGTRFVGEGGHFIDTISWWLGSEPVEAYAAATPGDADNLITTLTYADGSIANGDPAIWASGLQMHGTLNTNGQEADIATTAINADIGDLDGDYDLDLLLGARDEQPRLFRNELAGGVLAPFVDVTADFGMEMLQAAIAEYQGRDRRFGGLSKRSSA